ncbi:hypothetical protein [Desulfomonile tiedjei]|uniref:Uncharacterized protein n=1 Tax=Desulfomonile tiedjei (strain ATCC 49306 / DSM 6799 / DCB-1) TaxID=706587 RepID=I4C7T6_DESTA|nr:hypothetical protein [Desulfomonile tiedjei]AFM25627.1 hypothetical protein Desti_2958 [Desulfomonile tiedjei DSM 6799]
MSVMYCHRCGCLLPEGCTKYHVAVRIRSIFDEVLPEREPVSPEHELEQIMAEIETSSDEELKRQVYEDDVFILCLSCKEAFLDDIYSHHQPTATPESGRLHLIH